MRSLLSVAAGRRSRFVVLGAWVLLLIAVSPYSLKFDSVQNNESSSFLPQNAESLRAIDIADKSSAGAANPGLVVYSRSGSHRLNAADRDAITAAQRRITDRTRDLAGPISPPQFSRDGTAAVIAVPFEDTGDSDRFLRKVERLHDDANHALPRGLTARVGGGAGFGADGVRIFSNINGTLFAAAGGLVFLLLIVTVQVGQVSWKSSGQLSAAARSAAITEYPRLRAVVM